MQVFVSGASGYVGSAVIRALVARQHSVSALVRSAAAAGRMRELGATPVQGDILAPAVAWARETPDAVMHFAAAPAERQSDEASRRSDVLGAQRLAKTFPASHLLYASSIWVYGSSPELHEESAPLRPATGLGAVKQQAEEALREHPRRTILRLGAVYPGGAFSRHILAPLRAGRFFVPGPGGNHLGVIAIDDVAEAFVTAAEKSITGTFNWVDDEPLTWRAMADALAEHLKRRRPPSLPLWAVRLATGPELLSYVSTDLRIANARAKAQGFALRYPRLRDGLRAVA